VEVKAPAVVHYDIWVTKPFPELQAFCDKFDFDETDTTKDTFVSGETSNHMPYAIILIKAIAKWRAAHNGLLPASAPGLKFKDKKVEKDAFKAMIKSMKKDHG
jgi:hypothetical protein